MPTSSDNKPPSAAAKRLLARTPFVRSACDLDLMVFLYRHPRMLLTSEQLAGFVGYSLKDIAKSLDAFIEAGLMDRTAQQSTHAARLFVLLLDGPHGGGGRALVELASTRAGRESILQALNARGPRNGEPGGRAVLRLVGGAGARRRGA